MKSLIALALVLALSACTNIGEDGQENSRGNEAVLEGVDSSARMNEATLLPADSASTGVTH